MDGENNNNIEGNFLAPKQLIQHYVEAPSNLRFFLLLLHVVLFQLFS